MSVGKETRVIKYNQKEVRKETLNDLLLKLSVFFLFFFLSEHLFALLIIMNIILLLSLMMIKILNRWQIVGHRQ